MTTSNFYGSDKYMNEEPCETLYTDGGLNGANPSSRGGSWAWLLTNVDGIPIKKGSGYYKPQDIGLEITSSNNSELLAVINAFETLDEGWTGMVRTDSYCTLSRFVGTKQFWDGVLKSLYDRAIAAKKCMGTLTWELIAGHPERHGGKEALERGFVFKRENGRDRRYRVHKYNVACDKECTRLVVEARKTDGKG